MSRRGRALDRGGAGTKWSEAYACVIKCRKKTQIGNVLGANM